MRGTNWRCTLAALACARNDPLAPSATHPAITLTVNVAANAPGSVTNRATVSGGGDSNTTNDTADDATTITPPNPTSVGLIQSNVNGNESATSNMPVSFTSATTQHTFL